MGFPPAVWGRGLSPHLYVVARQPRGRPRLLKEARRLGLELLTEGPPAALFAAVSTVPVSLAVDVWQSDPSPRPLSPGGPGSRVHWSGFRTCSLLTVPGSLIPVSPWQVATLAEGREWSLESSPAQNWTPPQPKALASTAHR